MPILNQKAVDRRADTRFDIKIVSKMRMGVTRKKALIRRNGRENAGYGKKQGDAVRESASRPCQVLEAHTR